MRILGFDPGPANIGWAFITTDPLTRHKHGTHHIEYKFAETVRMGIAYKFVHDQIVYFSPDVVVVEDVFMHGKNFTAKDVTKVIGLIQLACDDRGVKCEILSPSEWQARIVRGKIARDRAERKTQVAEGIKRLLPGAPISPMAKAEHENDAFAIAIAFTLPSPVVKKKRRNKAEDATIKSFLAREAVVQG